jgi:hypothetical protein
MVVINWEEMVGMVVWNSGNLPGYSGNRGRRLGIGIGSTIIEEETGTSE